MKRPLTFLSLMLAIAAVSPGAAAGTYGEYLLDGSNTAWFVQLSDTHFDGDFIFLKYYPENIEWAFTEAVPVIQPNFVVTTGDLTDSTTPEGIYGQGPRPEEWALYKSSMAKWGMTPDYYFDVPGNHDAYGDGDLSSYVENSVQGTATGGTQQAWRVDLPGGALLFFSAATPGNDGKQWPSDNSELTTAELNQAEAFLNANKDAVFRMCFGHHDIADGVKNSANLIYLFNQNGVYYYSHGHEHDVGLRLDSNGVIRFRMDSLGQSEGNNLGLWAVDNRAVTERIYSAGTSWPILIITAPPNSRIGGGDEIVTNPYNPPVPRSCPVAPIRALVFDKKAVTEVTFRIDGGSWTSMNARISNPHQWRGYFDATKLSAGEHTVTVKAVGTGTSESSNTFFVEDGLPCNLGQEDPDHAPDGGSPDGSAKDGGLPDGGAVDSGSDSGPDGGTVSDAGFKDSGTDEDSGPNKDASQIDGASEEDGGAVAVEDGSSPDAEVVGPEDDTARQTASGCSCSTIGL